MLMSGLPGVCERKTACKHECGESSYRIPREHGFFVGSYQSGSYEFK